MTTAVVTVGSRSRAAHLAEQQRFLDALGRDDLVRVVGWLDGGEPEAAPRAQQLVIPPGRHGLRVGEGRNRVAGAALAAGADLLVFLDADCLPGPDLVDGYESAAARRPDALLAGPVTYLAQGAAPLSPARLGPHTAPHPARPAPPRGELVPGTHDLFWSLSFAATADLWRRLGGFDPVYEGYGAEDTDLGSRAQAASVPLVWVGGADAYHQWHPTSSPPWQHLDDILRNGALFAERWGRWPMGGWIDAFAAAGAITWDGSTWVRAGGAVSGGRMEP